MFAKASSGVGAEETLVDVPDADTRPLSWSRDCRYIAYMRRKVKGPTRGDIWIVPLFGDRKPFPFMQSEFEEAVADFSPDGRFIAYGSNESGRNEVYVAPFPGGGGKWQGSTAGGAAPTGGGGGPGNFFPAPDKKAVSAGNRAE